MANQVEDKQKEKWKVKSMEISHFSGEHENEKPIIIKEVFQIELA